MITMGRDGPDASNTDERARSIARPDGSAAAFAIRAWIVERSLATAVGAVGLEVAPLHPSADANTERTRQKRGDAIESRLLRCWGQHEVSAIRKFEWQRLRSIAANGKWYVTRPHVSPLFGYGCN